MEDYIKKVIQTLIEEAYWTKFVFFRREEGAYCRPRDKGFYFTEKGRPYFNTGLFEDAITLLVQESIDNFAFDFWQSLDYPFTDSLQNRRELLFDFKGMMDVMGLPLMQTPKYLVCSIKNGDKDIYDIRKFLDKLKYRPPKEFDPLDFVFEDLVPLYVHHEYLCSYPMFMLLPEKIYPEVHFFGEFVPKFHIHRDAMYCHFDCELKKL